MDQDDSYLYVGPERSRLGASVSFRGAHHTGEGCSKVGPITS